MNSKKKAPSVPGSRWRVSSTQKDGSGSRVGKMENVGIFDELVVDDWIHLEQMDTHYWWMRLGGVNFDLYLDKKGQLTIAVRNAVLEPYAKYAKRLVGKS